jgi:arginyl-tRNA synthetase
MITEQLRDLINKALFDLGLKEGEIPAYNLEHPDIISQGDFATNVALVLSKQLKRAPGQIAKEIVEKINLELQKDKESKIVQKVEVAGPGFINFSLSAEYFSKEIQNILIKKEKYGQKQQNFLSKFFGGKKVIVEHTDPNPFKEFHIGHLMSNSIGESVSRLIEALGSKVIPVSYGGDVGLHVAKAIFGYRLLEKYLSEKKERIMIYDQEKVILSHDNEGSFWGMAYALGSSEYENSEIHKREIDELNKEIFFSITPETKKLYDLGRKISIDNFQKLFKRLNTHFEHNFWESEVVKDALMAVEEGLAKNILEKSEGAIVFKGEKYGLHTRVFVNSKGVPTYEAKELGLGVKKISLYNFDSSVIITGNEQNDYFKVLLEVMGLLRPKVKDKTVHIGHGMLRFASGKMSSRKGNIITAVSLLEQVKQVVLEKMQNREFIDNEREEIAEIISIGAVKYSILKQAAGGDIIFDFDKSLSFEGDSGPYLQYACVRAKSILEKAKKEGIKINIDSGAEEVTGELAKMLIRFPEIVKRAGQEYAPHYLATYLTQLAGIFNTFYAQEIIVDKNNTNSSARVALTLAFSIVLKKGLDLLGIQVPVKM